jgi:DNA polymerase-1
MRRLFLLDGMALIYRAHFSMIPPIRNSKGVNTSALYGFINTLLAILEKEKPTHLGVAFDTSAPTPRHAKFPAYKAQRDEMPEELAAAIPNVKALCRAFHIPVLEMDGYEADDIIGTLVSRADAAGDFESFMVTPDKDFAQLVSPTVAMWKPGRKGADHEVMDLPAILNHWEIQHPRQVIDILGLWGDASDNIPGIPGVGEKTAKKLIAEYGSVENLIANAAKLKGKLRENVSTYADQAMLSKELATILCDVPIEITWDELLLSERDDDALKTLFTEFEFRTLTKRLFGDAPSPAQVVQAEAQTPTIFDTFKTIRDVPHDYHLVDTPERVQVLFSQLRLRNSFCFDIETTSLNRFEARILGVAFSWQEGEAWYLPYDVSLKENLREILEGPAEKIGHNLKYDLSVLLNHGIRVRGPFFDTMLADVLVCPERRHSMDYLAEILLGYTTVKLADLCAEYGDAGNCAEPDDLFAQAQKSRASKELDVTKVPVEVLAEYAAEDADITLKLSNKLRPLLEEGGQTPVMAGIEGPLLPVLVAMEMEGVQVDREALKAISNELQHQIDALAKRIHAHVDRSFNIASPKQLGEVLFDQLGLADKAKKTRTGQYKTDEQTLATLEGKHPIVAEILRWREATKLKSTYLDALPIHINERTGRIHTHFHQLVAATGRLASSDPNLQNIPIRSEAGRQIRKAFVPRVSESDSWQFRILSCDYSQIELRIMAALAGDATMIEAFRNQIDIHSTTAAKVFGVPLEDVTSDMRRTAKMVNFGIIYGISAFGLSQRLAIPRNEAAAIIDAYFREYPAIREFMDRTVEEARAVGYVQTLSGRRRYFPDLHSGNQNIRGNAERAAINTPIQGSAADMIKLAMIAVDRLLRDGIYKSRMLLQVHDELVFDLACHEEAEVVPQILTLMKTALPLPGQVPVEVEHGTGANWLAAH